MMIKHTKETFSQFSKIPRLNLINSCMGYKSANLIATKSADGISNVAVFSSVTHLGSDPALLGFILRPNTVPRDTYTNLKATGFFTVNAITENMISAAHQSSAAYDASVSEFEMTDLEEEYLDEIEIPFVKGSPVRLLCRYVNEYPITENNTIHIIASIEAIYYDEMLEREDKWLQLDKAKIVSINGLDGYALPQLLNRFEYARVNQELKEKL
jgi:flavin reductase (DIM6/NTAB) family NADH-FMN oxidoreductase RutF